MVKLHLRNNKLPISKQGAFFSGPQNSFMFPTQQLDDPPGLALQPFPPQIPHSAGQHAFSFAFIIPPYCPQSSSNML